MKAGGGAGWSARLKTSKETVQLVSEASALTAVVLLPL